jgi:glutaredoxin 3
MPQIDIYTGFMCGYCSHAKSLLKQKSASFREIKIGMSSQLLQEMLSRSGGKSSVPQVFIGDLHVGGCDELYALDKSGKLDKLLAGE